MANKIIGVAIMHKDGTNFCSMLAPARHHDVIRVMVNDGIDSAPISGTQGFIDDEDNFLDRHEAYQFAIKHDLITRDQNGYKGDRLFSEALW